MSEPSAANGDGKEPDIELFVKVSCGRAAGLLRPIQLPFPASYLRQTRFAFFFAAFQLGHVAEGEAELLGFVVVSLVGSVPCYS